MDWSSEVFPQLLEEGKPVYGYVAEGYWEDVGTHESYVKAQADVLTGKVDTEIDGFETAPGVFVAEGAEIDPAAILKGPCYIGPYSKIEAGVELREHTVIGSQRGHQVPAPSCTARSSTATSISVRRRTCAAA